MLIHLPVTGSLRTLVVNRQVKNPPHDVMIKITKVSHRRYCWSAFTWRQIARLQVSELAFKTTLLNTYLPPVVFTPAADTVIVAPTTGVKLDTHDRSLMIH
jgi:hypothetical protein